MRNKGVGKGRSSSQQANSKAKSRTEKKNSSRSGGASDGHLEDSVATTHLSALNDIYNEDNWVIISVLCYTKYCIHFNALHVGYSYVKDLCRVSVYYCRTSLYSFNARKSAGQRNVLIIMQ